MSYMLFLDDFRNPQDCTHYMHARVGNEGNILSCYSQEWVICRSYDEFRATIEARGVPHAISFDHDLSDSHYANYHAGIDWQKYYDDPKSEPTGWHRAASENHRPRFPYYLIHSMNEQGAKNIHQLIIAAGFPREFLPIVEY